VYQRRVSLTGHQWDPPDTATGVLDDGVIGVVEGCKAEGVDALEFVLVVFGAGVVDVVPGAV
jgi:hypothetical protein